MTLNLLSKKTITQSSTLSTAIAPTVVITSLTITNSSWNPINQTKIDNTGGYLKVNGSLFENGCTVYVGGVLATSVLYVSSSELRVTFGSVATGNYSLFVGNPSGSAAIYATGIGFSGPPTWVTDSSLGSYVTDNLFSISLSAVSDSNITYTLASGSSLPIGTTLSASGIFSGTVTVGADTIYSFSVVATDAENQPTTKAFTITIQATDPYFRYTTLLLKGDTPSSSYWLSDASTNNFALTSYGDAKAAQLTPFNTSWSNYFNASNLRFAYSTALNISYGDFTIEFWVNGPPQASANVRGFTYFNGAPASSANIGWDIIFETTGAITFAWNSGTSFSLAASSALNRTWNHIAITRSGNSFVMYLNGVSTGTATNSTSSNSDSGWGVYLGAVSATNTGNCNDLYFSNVRIVKGTVVYTGAFTPPTSPLTAITNTVLLTCQSNYFKDNSIYNYTPTLSGTTGVLYFSPFGTSLTGGGGFFDGTGDYLIAPSNAVYAFSSNFTVEAWVYLAAYPGTSSGAYITDFRSGNANNFTLGLIGNSSKAKIYAWVNSVSVTCTTTLELRAWYHIAFVRNGSTLTCYLNGVPDGTLTSSYSQSATSVYIGSNTGVTELINGYISNLRVVNGVAVYNPLITNYPSTALPLNGSNVNGDIYFNYNTLQLSGDSLTGATWITDASTNNFAITSVGDAKASSLTPFNTSWSNYFNGSSDYIYNAAGNADLAFGTGDFTVECWVYLTTAPTNGYGAPVAVGSAGAAWAINCVTSGSNFYFRWDTATSGGGFAVTGNYSPNQWLHIAYVRSGTTLTGYVNGVVAGTQSSYTENLTVSNNLYIGTAAGNTARYLPGYVSNIRVVKGAAVYTSNFNTPTSPLSVYSSGTTSLLTCQSGYFKDNSTNNFTFTIAGSPTIQYFNPFGTSLTGGSGYFDGTGDYITLTPTTALQLAGNNFTIEMWVYFTAVAGTKVLMNYGYEGSTQRSFIVYHDGSVNTLRFAFSTTGSNNTDSSLGSFTPTVGQWYHIAVVRATTTVTAYVNGSALNAPLSIAANVIYYPSTSAAFRIAVDATNYFTGYISNTRIVNGVAVYTGTFTPPNTTLAATQSSGTNISAITGTATSLLTLQNAQPTQNASFTDGSQNNFAITRNGDATQGTFTPFSQTGWSNYFNGSTDYLVTNYLPNIGTNNFTVECWIYMLALPGSTTSIWYSGNGGGNVPKIYFQLGTTGTLAVAVTVSGGANNITSTATINTSQWTHLALVRSGSTLTLYFNGASVGTTTNSVNLTGISGGLQIGFTNDGAAGYFNGYISNFRFVNGTAVYTATFTPSTIPLLAIAGTTLLTCQSNRFVDFSANSATITTSGTPAAKTFSPFVPITYTPSTYSAYFNGSTGYLTVSGTTAFNFGTADFTFECWVYQIDINAGTRMIASLTPYGAGNTGWAAYFGAGYIAWFVNNANRIVSTSPVVAGTWNHLAVVRSSGSTIMYLNGVVTGSTYADSTNYSGTAQYIGADPTQYYSGLISNLRTVKGTAVYTANFTPPTSSLTAVANTSLLTCQNSTFIDNSSNAFTITSTGNTKPVTSPTPFSPTIISNPIYTTALVGGSAYFDGTADQLTLANSAAFDVSSLNFTVDCWVYLTGSVGSIINYSNGQAANSNFAWELYEVSASTVQFSIVQGSTQYTASSTGFSLNAWNYIAAVRNGNTMTLYVNGTAGGTTANVTGVTANNPSAATLKISGYNNATGILTGYVSNVRIVKGTALYTANFAPPITPSTIVTNTSLLLNYTNLAVYDATSTMDLQTVGFAQISATQSKFGGSSLYFPSASGDYLVSYNNVAMGTGDCTIEAWIYPLFTNASAYGVFVTGPGGTANNLRFGVNANQLYLDILGASVFASSGPTISSNAWTHIAVTRASGTWRGYINGIQMGSTTTQGTVSITGTERYVGTIGPTGGGTTGFNGYIDDLRITQGYARYTTPNFIVPASPLAATQQAATYISAITGTSTSLLTLQNTQPTQNASFVDSSPYNFPITKFANSTQGTFSPFSLTGWSCYFPSQAYVYYASNPITSFGIGTTWTVEGWIFLSSEPSSTNTFSFLGSGDQSTLNYWSMGVPSGRIPKIYWFDGAGKTASATNTIPLNTWTYIAFQANSGAVSIYINGIQETLTGTTTLTNPTGNSNYLSGAVIGSTGVGYLSNLRCSNTAVYSSNFSVPTAPSSSTLVSGTVRLLTFNSYRFVDSTATVTLSTFGNSPSIQSFSPFAPTGSYNPTVVGGSAYFDGTGDYLTVSSNPAFDLSASNHTIECWVYLTATAAVLRICEYANGRAANSNYAYSLTAESGIFRYTIYSGITGYLASVSAAVAVNQWCHVAGVRNGTTVSIYVNGVVGGTTATCPATTNNPASSVLYISSDTASPVTGYVSNLRITKGTAIYTTNFTLPTIPVAATSNTSLLLNFVNTGVYDSTGKNDLETVADARVNSTVVKYGNGSMYFDGTGDYLKAAFGNPLFYFGAENWTVECWVYLNSTSGTQGILFGQSDFAIAANASYEFYATGSGSLFYYNGSSNLNLTAPTITVSTWTHLAWVRNSTTITLYVNGVSIGLVVIGTGVINNGTTNPVTVGAKNGGTAPFNGYIDDLRITKGIARYTTTPFTPPTNSFPTR